MNFRTPRGDALSPPARIRLCRAFPSLWRAVGCALWLMGGVLVAQDPIAAPAAAAPVEAAAAPAPSNVSDAGILTAAVVLAASFIIGSLLMRQKAP